MSKFKVGDVVHLDSKVNPDMSGTYYIHHFQGSDPEEHMYYIVPEGKEYTDHSLGNYGACASEITLKEIWDSPLFSALNESVE